MLSLGIKDIIDIFLVALLLYYIWKLMKQSSAANIFSGVIIFTVVWILVSRVFEMRLIGGIMDNLMNIGLLAVIILFQDEIRHFLSTIGNQKNAKYLACIFHLNKEVKSHRTDIMPIVMACLSMSKQKVGALIIVERGVNLTEYINTGEIINGKISQRLIENIFFKNSPLHDGAMIISNSHITAAGCILPVSHDTDIPKALGLRHRSALGISQKSDCLAICVSEETGGISIAENGHFHLRLNAEELERMLTEEWQD